MNYGFNLVFKFKLALLFLNGSWTSLVFCTGSLRSTMSSRCLHQNHTFTFTHLADAFIQSDLQWIQAIHFCHYVCSLGIEPTTFALLTQCSTTEPQEHKKIDCKKNERSVCDVTRRFLKRIFEAQSGWSGPSPSWHLILTDNRKWAKRREVGGAGCWNHACQAQQGWQ